MRYTGFHRALAILHREHQRTWQIHLCNEIQTEALDQYRNQFKEAGQQPPSFTALVVKAIAIGMRYAIPKYPELNSYLRNQFGFKSIHAFKRITAGVAISREEQNIDQAMCAVLQDPDNSSLTDMTRKLHEFSTKPAHEIPFMRNCYYLYRLPTLFQRIMLWIGRSFPSKRLDYRGTFTLTSVGKFGVDYQLTLPQASSMQFGFGHIQERPVVRDGKVVPARTFNLTVSFDRRLMNGKPVAYMMHRIREVLENAEFPDKLNTAPDSTSSTHKMNPPTATA